jgi:hypothetical protein
LRHKFLRIIVSGLVGYANSMLLNSTSPEIFSNISPFVLLESMFGILDITFLILSPAELASEKFLRLDKLDPNPLFHIIRNIITQLAYTFFAHITYEMILSV